MKMIVDPDRIEELGRQLKNFSLDVEGMYRYVHDMVTKLVDAVDAKYHESYVRANTRALREALGRLRGNTETASRNLQDLSRYALESAQEYRARDSQLARLIAQSSIKFGLNFDMQKVLSGIYRVTGVSTAIGSRLAVGNLNIKLGTGRVTALLAGGIIPTLINKLGTNNEQEKERQEAMAKLDEIIRVEKKIVTGKIYPTYHIAKLLSEKSSVVETLLKFEEDKELKELLMRAKERDTLAWDEYIMKKTKQYLHTFGFDVEEEQQKGVWCHKGIWGYKCISAIIVFQYSTGLEIDSKPNITTLVRMSELAQQAKGYDDIFKEFVPEENPAVEMPDELNGHLPQEVLDGMIEIGTVKMQESMAVAYAYLLHAVTKEDEKEIDFYKFTPVSDIAAYRQYKDQVRMYAGYYLAQMGFDHPHNKSKAAKPEFDVGLSEAQKFIWEHREEFRKNKYFFDDFVGEPGSNKPLSGYGTSPHGDGVAIDMAVEDPGGGDPDRGEGYATKNEVIWLEEHAYKYGFKPYLQYEGATIINDKGERVNYYKETWHWVYKPQG